MILPRIIPDVYRQTLSSPESNTVDVEETDCACNHVHTRKDTDGLHYLPVVTLQSFMATSDTDVYSQTDDELSVAFDTVPTEDIFIDDANIADVTISEIEVNNLSPLPPETEVPSVDYTDGIQLNEVEDLIRYSDIRLGWNLWFYQYQEVTLLMKDGRGYTGLSRSLESLDPLESQSTSPHRWFSWRTNDSGEYERLNDTTGQWVKIRGYSIFDQSTQPKTIDADVANTQHSGLWNIGGLTSTTGYRFHASGHFEMYMSLMSQYQEYPDGPNININKDSHGSEFTAMQTVPVGHVEVGVIHVDEQRQVDDSMFGTYHISGNTLVLVFSNGATRSELFADCHGGGLLIGSKLYV